MSRLYIVRHGETVWNTERKTQGMKDSALTEKGIIQAKKLSERLALEKIDYIYSSSLSRAYETAKIISSKLNLAINITDDLREMNFGCWQGLTIEEVKNNYPNEHIIWHSEPHKWSISGSETLIQVRERTLKLVNDLRKKHINKNILLVSHGTAIKALLLGILDIDLSNYRKIAQDNTSINVIEYRGDLPVIKFLNDTNHLREVK